MSADRKKKLKKKSVTRLKPSVAPALTPVQPFAWGPFLEACTGWCACLMIVVSPLVFHPRISNFADLPQRTVVQAGVALLCVLALARGAVLQRFELPKSWSCAALAAFALWALMSVFWSINPYEAVYAALHWAACALAALVLADWLRSDAWLARCAGAIVASGLLVSAVANAQYFLGFSWIPARSVPSAAFGNANMMAEFLCCTIIISAFAGWYMRRRSVYAVLCWLVTAAGLVMLFPARCRAAWLAIGVAILWFLALQLKRIAGRRVFAVAVAVLLAVCSWAGWHMMTSPGAQRDLDGSARYRMIVWNNSFELIQQKPFVGYGAGSFPRMYGSVVNTRQSDRAFDKDVQIRRVHNDFVQTAVELGLPGLALLVFFAGGVLGMAARLSVPGGSAFERFIVNASSCALVAFLVTGFFSFPFQRALTPLLAFLCAAMIIALYCRRHDGFVRLSNRSVLIAAAVCVGVAGLWVLRFNMSIIESDRYFRQALSMEKRQQNSSALDFGLKAIAARPERMDALTTVGRAYITTGRLDDGITALETVVARHPYNLNALFILGAGYANAGRSDEALEVFRRVLEIRPEFAEARQIVSHLKAHGRVKVNLR